MKNALAGFCFFTSLGLATAALAGPGDGCHFHGSKPAAESVVIKCADQRKASLVKGGKLHDSWGPIKHESVGMIDGKKGKEWRVIYKNQAAADKTKITLYMFFTPVGNFIAANYTGQ